MTKATTTKTVSLSLKWWSSELKNGEKKNFFHGVIAWSLFKYAKMNVDTKKKKKC
jgi:hypothetical protein